MTYVGVRIEGGLLPASLLETIVEREAGQQRAAIQQAFSDALGDWQRFRTRLRSAREPSAAARVTANEWIRPLFRRLGYEIVRANTELIHGESFRISHRLGANEGAPPLHVVAFPPPENEAAPDHLDRPAEPAGGRRRLRSPHALLQEFLNRTDNLWGIVTDGARLRLLRNSARVARPVYLEFDVRAIMDDQVYPSFVALYALLHAGRLPADVAQAPECPIEKDYQLGLEEGGRVRERLRDGVKEAIEILGQALLTYRENDSLRCALATHQLSSVGYYQELLRLVYRLLFLMVIEERRLVYPDDAPAGIGPEAYARCYSITRLRERCDKRIPPDPHVDLWSTLLITFRLFRDADLARKLDLKPLGGIFTEDACPHIEAALCRNDELLRAMRALSTFVDESGRGRTGVRRPVNYAALDTEELGSVYESLLDYEPQIDSDQQPGSFKLAASGQRKSTGSYYTPDVLVRELVESALKPVLEARLAKAHTKDERERAVLDLRVCDPASGSGHFLLAAARYLARELARARTEEEDPAPAAYRRALRDVIRVCLYAVDRNPLAVELCKVALWLEGHCAGEPLSFLDAHVKCGDSLVGVRNLTVLTQGIPDEAYDPLEDDDRKVARDLKQRNARERRGQLTLDEVGALAVRNAREVAELSHLVERNVAEAQAKQELYRDLTERDPNWWTLKVACDLWTAAFFLPKRAATGNGATLVPTSADVRAAYAGRPNHHGQMVGAAQERATTLRFFHWPLEFPDIFAANGHSGFDVVLANPPWERIKLQEQEFFATRDPAIANARNKAEREQLIKRLATEKPQLWHEFKQALRDADGVSLFLRASGRYPLCGRGDINTYSVFTELARTLLATGGRAGLIVPSGIATDATTSPFFRDLVQTGALISLFDFQNGKVFFPNVDSRVKFCLVTLANERVPNRRIACAFYLHAVEELRDSDRRLELEQSDFARFNPNTLTCPIFRTRRDLVLARRLYSRGVLVRKPNDGHPGANPWGIRFLAMFHMANDSGLFGTREQLEGQGYRLEGNIFTNGEERWLPLYEAKLFHQFDHRYATFADVTAEDNKKGNARDVSVREHEDADYFVIPRYWVREAEVLMRTERRSEDARTIKSANLNREPRAFYRSDLRLTSGLSSIRAINRHEDSHRDNHSANRSRGDSIVAYPSAGWYLVFRDIVRSTDERTAVGSVLPLGPVGHSAPVIEHALQRAVVSALLAANLNSFVFDWVARLKVGGTNLSFFIVEQLPVLPPAAFLEEVWPGEPAAAFIVPRALELTYTAGDLASFARDLGYDGPPFRWDEERRFLIRCELDALFFHLYLRPAPDGGWQADDLSAQALAELRHAFPTPRDAVAYVMDGFPIVEKNDNKRWGEYRTKRVVLERFDAMQEARALGAAYRSPLDPPPADQRAAHPFSAL